jgi:hypothetical protein
MFADLKTLALAEQKLQEKIRELIVKKEEYEKER